MFFLLTMCRKSSKCL